MSLKISGDHSDQHLRKLTRKAETHKVRKRVGTHTGVNTALSTKTDLRDPDSTGLIYIYVYERQS